jgi:hypothetical protein
MSATQVQYLPMKIKKALSVIPLIAGLKSKKNWTPESIADFALSNPAIRPLQVRSELQRFAQIVADTLCHGPSVCIGCAHR